MSWDKLYTILFNPNHEFSLQIFIVIAVICIVVPNLAQWMITRRRNRIGLGSSVPKDASPTYHTPKKKKRSKKK